MKADVEQRYSIFIPLVSSPSSHLASISVRSWSSPAPESSIGPLQENTAAFEACSKERIQPFDDEEEEDIWEEKEINYATLTKSRNR